MLPKYELWSYEIQSDWINYVLPSCKKNNFVLNSGEELVLEKEWLLKRLFFFLKIIS